ncbi:uncharacterized protein LOC18423576 isoform X6 [Amborella trichopoda]|uniref:uncharacterized protein LOC18423576 isoform X6 n=1 Tax=Amborella trichopoda TaxID=13333 RepID=UPI0009C1143C|nr:uncharacterized protein LOC18423576 isoform X6 [Amborella trichopoda]XP_020529912.1 uncharacterized protein LOC18423576 isoform X6 [Amborella trichopoda]|eukprot:XP_020529909.1 uncharacterized protein LOC18423576 isoform X6 [Amborella trichopoda]
MKKLLHVYTIMICYGNLGSMALAHGLSCDFRSKYSLTSLPVTACATAPQYSCPIFRERFLPLQISQNPFLSPLTVPERHVLSPKSIPRVHFLSLDSLRRRYHKQTEVVSGVEEELPPEMVSTSEPPNLFDGTTRLYISYVCPFAQRVWIARNYKGLQDEMKLVPINLANRPSWYKEKVYPPNQVPALEHNKKVIGESLDLLYYLDTHFEGPKLLPDDPAKRTFAEELIGCCGDFIKVRSAFSKEDIEEEVDCPCYPCQVLLVITWKVLFPNLILDLSSLVNVAWLICCMLRSLNVSIFSFWMSRSMILHMGDLGWLLGLRVLVPDRVWRAADR